MVAALVAALAVASPALAKSKCGEQVLADWFDNGRIDRIYDLHCYEDAIDIIPEDIRVYADAEEVITRALQGALEGKLVTGGSDPTPGRSDNGSSDPPGSGGSPGGPDDGDSTAAPDVDTSAPSSVPIPLLVLGGLSLALLGAGGLGYVSRRRNAVDGDGPDDDLFA